MEKRFIVIECKTLGDQWECDADRKIQPVLCTEEEVKSLFREKSYYNPILGEEFATAEICKMCTLLDYDGNLEVFLEDCGYETEEEAWAECCQEIYSSSIEVYEIKDNALIFREDLSTYEG